MICDQWNEMSYNKYRHFDSLIDRLKYEQLEQDIEYIEIIEDDYSEESEA